MHNAQPPAEYLTSGDIAKLAGVSASAVHVWIALGKLLPATTTAGGVRLFKRGDVEAFVAARGTK